MIRKNQYIFFLIYFSLLSADITFVPDDFMNIQQAIDNSISGDTVIVNPGLYIENINRNYLKDRFAGLPG